MCVRLMMSCVSSTMGLSDAAEFIRRAAFVDTHECSVEYKKLSQVQYYALFKDPDDSKAINEALTCSGA